MRSRLLAVAGLAATTALVLSGCGSSADPSGPGGAQGTQELSVWFNDPGPVLQPVIQGMMETFESEHEGVSINLRFVGGADVHQQYVTAIAGGAPPCVALLGNTWTGEFAQMGALAKLDLTPAKANERFVSAMVESATFEDAVYGYPFNVANRALVYRTDLFEASGVEVPETWDDLKAAAQKISADNEGVAGFGITGGEIYYYLPLVWNWGGEWAVETEDGWTATLNTPEAKQALDFYASLLRDAKVAPSESASWTGPDTTQNFAMGKVGMAALGSWQLKQLLAQAPELEDVIGTAQLPKGPAGNNDTFAGGSNLVVFEQCAYQDTAKQLLEFLEEPDQVTQYTAGIGMLPASREAMEQEKETGSFSEPMWTAFADQAEHTRIPPTTPRWGAVEGSGVIVNAMQALMHGTGELDATIEKLNDDVERALRG